MEERIRAAWQGRISGCLLGKPLEMLSMREGFDSLQKYLQDANSLPLRDYVNYIENPNIRGVALNCCKNRISKAEIDDDITYTVLALMMLEQYGLDLTTDDVARSWINMLPAGATFTAEREAYIKILENINFSYQFGGERDFDLNIASDNKFNDWIGAQIRIDMYGWTLPGKPEKAAQLARTDAKLSHRGCAVECSAFIAALAAAIPSTDGRKKAVEEALKLIDKDSSAFDAVQIGMKNSNKNINEILKKYKSMSPVHSLNNLAVVTWAFLSFSESFDQAVGEAVAAGWDTDCNGATVGGLVGLADCNVPEKWHLPWNGKVNTSIAGLGELRLEDLIQRTITITEKLNN